jgi:hypothetical protein
VPTTIEDEQPKPPWRGEESGRLIHITAQSVLEEERDPLSGIEVMKM